MSYLASLIVELGVSVLYGLLGLRSRLRRVAARPGLLGMLTGEKAVAMFRSAVTTSHSVPGPSTDHKH